MLLEKGAHQSLEIGTGTQFFSPVRSGGFGTLHIGQNNSFGFNLAPRLGTGEILIQDRCPDSMITVGDNNHFSNNISVVANERITIGNRCLFGDLVAIYDCDFHEMNPLTRHQGSGPTAPVSIGDNVWIGSRSIILKGVTVGDNSVIAAMSLVNKSVPPNCVVGGVPARIIKDL